MNEDNKYINIKDVAEAKGLTSTRSIRLELNKIESKYISQGYGRIQVSVKRIITERNCRIKSFCWHKTIPLTTILTENELFHEFSGLLHLKKAD